MSVNPALYAKLKEQMDPATPRVLTEREKMLRARRARQNKRDAVVGDYGRQFTPVPRRREAWGAKAVAKAAA